MIGIAMYTTIETLWKRHKNKSKIARLTGHDWKVLIFPSLSFRIILLLAYLSVWMTLPVLYAGTIAFF